MGLPEEEDQLRWLATVTLNDGTEDGVQFEEFPDLASYLGLHYQVGTLPWIGMIRYGSLVNIPMRSASLVALVEDTGMIVESGPDWNDITSLALSIDGRPSRKNEVTAVKVELQIRTRPAQPSMLH